MNKQYNLKLDLQFRCNNQAMKFNQFDNNTSDFFIKINNGGKTFDIEKAMIVLASIKPSGKVSSQFIEVNNGVVYADLKPNMVDEIGVYTAQAMLILEDERVVTDTITYEVNESNIISAFIEDVETQEDYTLLTDMLSRLSTIEISEEQRMINEAERILAEENRKIEEAKRVEAELVRQHEEADRAKYDATREGNENIRKLNEDLRKSNENIRLENEIKRVEEENKRKLAEEERNANYNFMTEDEERRRLEANAHKEAEVLRVQAETNRVNEEAKRRTTEQARVSNENTRVSNENTRKSNEEDRKSNETSRVNAETQRQTRYNTFIVNAEANANEFKNYTKTAKADEEDRKANELERKSQEDRRLSNEITRISSENTRKANEATRDKNETSRQNVFTSKVNEVDKKISEIEKAKSDMTNAVSNKVDEVENRFNALTSKQQQDAEVIDARDGEVSLKARLDRDVEKAKEIYVDVEGSNISTDSTVGYAKNVEILGNTIQDINQTGDLADIRSVGDKVEGQELYKIDVVSCGKNLNSGLEVGTISNSGVLENNDLHMRSKEFIQLYSNNLSLSTYGNGYIVILQYDKDKKIIGFFNAGTGNRNNITLNQNVKYIKFRYESTDSSNIQIEYGPKISSFEPYQEDKLTILSPVQLEKVGDVADRIICKDGVWGVEKNIKTIVLDGTENWRYSQREYYLPVGDGYPQNNKIGVISDVLPSKLTNYTLYPSNTFAINLGSAVYGIIIRNDEFVDNASGFKSWLRENNVTAKYSISQPQFMPLPHDQQVKLRTFASKTNISFLTEIEGIIKASVPKSLGATVNTHTEQIDSLNKKVFKIEEIDQVQQDMMILESDIRILDMELALMEHMPVKLNLGENSMLRSATYFNFLKNHIINETYSKDYLENVMNKYLATNRLTQEEYNELYKMLYPPVYDIALPIE